MLMTIKQQILEIFGYKVIFANLWCFGWILDLLGKLSGGEINALLRTTVAFTQMKGSSASNVIPPECEMVSNMRLNPHDTVESALSEIKKKVNNDNVEVIKLSGLSSFFNIRRTISMLAISLCPPTL